MSSSDWKRDFLQLKRLIKEENEFLKFWFFSVIYGFPLLIQAMIKFQEHAILSPSKTFHFICLNAIFAKGWLINILWLIISLYFSSQMFPAANVNFWIFPP